MPEAHRFVGEKALAAIRQGCRNVESKPRTTTPSLGFDSTTESEIKGDEVVLAPACVDR